MYISSIRTIYYSPLIYIKNRHAITLETDKYISKKGKYPSFFAPVTGILSVGTSSSACKIYTSAWNGRSKKKA